MTWANELWEMACFVLFFRIFSAVSMILLLLLAVAQSAELKLPVNQMKLKRHMPSSLLGSSDVPADGFPDTAYSITMTFGTPPQQVRPRNLSNFAIEHTSDAYFGGHRQRQPGYVQFDRIISFCFFFSFFVISFCLSPFVIGSIFINYSTS